MALTALQKEYAPEGHDYEPRVIFADPDGRIRLDLVNPKGDRTAPYFYTTARQVSAWAVVGCAQGGSRFNSCNSWKVASSRPWLQHGLLFPNTVQMLWAMRLVLEEYRQEQLPFPSDLDEDLPS